MNKRKISIISTLLTLTLSLSVFAGCGGSDSTSTSGTKTTVEKKQPGEPTSNKEKVLQMGGNWAKPPAFNGNWFNTNGRNSLEDIIYERLFVIIRVGTGKLHYQLAESVEHKEDKTIVHLRKGVKWHDGQPFTSKDIWAYYVLNNSVNVLKYVTGIDTPDDYTVVFNWAKPVVFEDMRMKLIAKDLSGTIPYHIYKEYVDKANEILKKAKPTDDMKKKRAFGLDITSELKKDLTENFQKFKDAGPATPIGTGPYKFDKVDDNQMIAVKNKDYYGADKVHFETIKFIRGGADLAQDYAMLRNGDFDIAYGTPPKDILESMIAGNQDLLHYKMFDMASYGVMFNIKKEPFNDVKFRQAIAYIVDKGKVREVGNYYGKEFPEISAIGFPPSVMKDYISKDTKLTNYTRSEEKASKLLQELGWKKGSDGSWVDKNDKKPEFVIASDASFDVTLNSAQVVAEQLTKFGLNTKVKAVDSSVFWTNTENGEYDMTCYLMDMCWSMNDAWDGLKNAYVGLAKMNGLPSTDEELKLPGRNGQIVDVHQEIDKYCFTNDKQERQNIINELAYIYNENAFSINLFQTSYGVYINLKNVNGNFPMEEDFQKYNRDMPLATDTEVNDRIIELNCGFQSNRFWVNGEYWPR